MGCVFVAELPTLLALPYVVSVVLGFDDTLSLSRSIISTSLTRSTKMH